MPLSPKAVKQIMCLTFDQEQSSLDHLFQVSLKSSAVDLWTLALEVLDCQTAVLQHVLDGLRLSTRKAVPFDQNIAPNRQFPTLFDLGQLGGQALDEVLLTG